jgi:hypothetical protein
MANLAFKLFQVQKDIGAVAKKSANTHFKSKYADLNEVLDVAKGALHKQGLFLAQASGADQYGKYVETTVMDSEDGQGMNCRVYFSGSEDNMQKIGAAITYGRRFGILSLLAMESEDDDGESLVRPQPAKPESTKYVPKPAGVRSVTPVIKAVAAATTPETHRDSVLKKISLTSKVLLDSKKLTSEEAHKMVKSYGVWVKEDLSDEQAVKLLAQLEERLNG